MNDKISIRKAQEEDFNTIIKLNESLVKHGSKFDYLLKKADKTYEEWLADRFADEGSCFMVALCGEKIIGYQLSWMEQRPYMNEIIGYVCDGYIEEHFRRQGIGKKMISSTIDWFQKNGIKCIEVDVHSANKSAIGFLEGTGFEENSKRMRLEV